MFKNFLNKTNKKARHTSTLICINFKRNNIKISSRKPKNSHNCENIKKKYLNIYVSFMILFQFQRYNNRVVCFLIYKKI